MTTQKLFDNFSRKTDVLPKLGYGLFWLALFVASLGAGKNAYAAVQCDKTITANVVVLDNPTIFNRLGAQNPNWITYALERDVVYVDWGNPTDSDHLKPITRVTMDDPETPDEKEGKTWDEMLGHVELRPDKRPRPLVIRSVEGACLTVNFRNLLTKVANPNNAINDNPFPFENTDAILINNNQVAGRCAGFHASGTELATNSTANDGSMVGANDGGGNAGFTNEGQSNCGEGLAAPGESRTYHLYTPHEGAFIINSYGATVGSEANGGNLGLGMFGALNVQPKGARIYRSQVTEEEMRLATTGETTLGQPIINYEATYPGNAPWTDEGKDGLPIINMLAGPGCDTADWTACELVHSDINAIIAGPDSDGTWYSKCPGADCPYPLESVGKKNPQLPQRLEAYREFTSQYHDEQTNAQVFPNWYNNPVMSHVLHGVGDAFMINYGSGGIGSEIIANRLHAGPMHDCTDCAYEEFFLASQTVGDPALLVAFPANTGIEACDPAAIAGPTCWRDPVNLANGPIEGNIALYQEDPSNVHHAYTGDFVKYRNTHAGAFEQHIFHFHNHQWLFNPNDDNANYLDAQEIMPGSGHTYELVNGGAGNRNHTVGDAIFHCHFYPHFAQGMWYHQRNHDVFETGTVLAVSNADNAQKAAPFDSVYPQANFHANAWDLRSGQPAKGSRALPDGELPDGSPIPAIIPLPGKPMPHMPAHVEIRAVDRGAHSLLGGRLPPDGIADSSQAIVDRASTVDADGNFVTPGYPFWLAGNECGPGIDPAYAPELLVGDECPQGIVGQRMPTPPLDMLTDTGARLNAGNPNPEKVDWSNLGGGWDGGLPRHALLGYVSTGLSKDTNSRLDFRKVIEMAKPVYFPETGTDLEKVSMAYQAVRHRDSYANNFTVGAETPADAVTFTPASQGGWVLNGAPPVPGGPYNDPCVDDRGVQLTGGHVGEWYDGDDLDRWGDLTTKGRSSFDAENPRTYKIANLQIDAVFNKVGYHYSQERIIILWEDVKPTIFKERPPEPLVMRFNTFDCGKLLHANLVPHEFEVDDFQVRTPTDIIGQHIHLPKWDLTTNDGAANGWNYEDGALSPGIVEERIHSINRFNNLVKLGADCATDGTATWTDPLAKDDNFKTFTCANFIQDDPNTLDILEGPTLVAGSLPGQLSPINLGDQSPVLTIDTGDPGGTPAGQFDLVAQNHPFFLDGGQAFGGQHYKGARTVIQRLLVDPVVNVAGVDRGLGLTFSHDHYGPSTFQQIGLYSTILAEPAGSTWVHNESGEPLGWVNAEGSVDIDGFRDDGGPTSWQAAILTPNAAPNGSTVKSEDIPDHREFYFEMSDFQHAYEDGVYVGANDKGVPQLTAIDYNGTPFDATDDTAPLIEDKWLKAVNPTLKLTANGGVNPGAFPDTVNAHPGCPGPLGQNDPSIPRPCAEAINIGHSSMWVVNYRNEPIGLRVFDPDKMGPDGKKGTQAGGWNEKGNYIDPKAGDLAFALMSLDNRAIPELNSQFGLMPYPVFQDRDAVTNKPEYLSRDSLDPTGDYCDGINCDRRPGDPITPIMRAYERDHVKVKIQVGATEEQHQTTIHGLKWLSNGSGFGRGPNSGWRNFQSHGISEQFSLQVPITTAPQQPGDVAEYLYATDATRDGMWSGTWGILRGYRDRRTDLYELPSNLAGQTVFANDNPDSGLPAFNGVCPSDAPVAHFDVSAVLANDVLGNVIITGNRKDGTGTPVPDIIIQDNAPAGPRAPGFFANDNEGGPLNPDGGTLVYNRRGTEVPDVTIAGEGGEPNVTFKGGFGPLNDPTAMMYVMTADLEPMEGWENDPNCQEPDKDGVMLASKDPTALATCPVKLKDTAPVEPIVLRANAGDCIEVTLRNRLPDVAPDLAGWLDTFWVVNRDLGRDTRPPQMSFFGNNLIRPSSHVGLHPQLVAYDVNQHDGVQVGQTDDFDEEFQLAPPGGSKFYRWYAGDTRFVDADPTWCTTTEKKGGGPGGGGGQNKGTPKCVEIVATPVEFGAVNLLSADRIKQPQKGMFGALVIEPANATVAVDTMVPDGQGNGTDTRPTRAQVTVTADADPDMPGVQAGDAGSSGTYRETLAMSHKITNLRWADGSAIKNVGQAEFGVEGAEDSGHAGFNYAMEPSWFRFKLPPDVPSAGAKKKADGTPDVDGTYGTIPNPQAMYANALVAGEPNAIPAAAGISKAGDPQTPVFITNPDQTNPVFDTRMFLLNGASADRDSTYVLHGHVWQRDPHVCVGDSQDYSLDDYPDDGLQALLPGRCDTNEPVPSQALGLNPQAKYMGGEEGMGHVFAHWPILFDAGGTGAVRGDYLYRDYAPNGNRNGMFGILRVTDDAPVEPPPPEDPPPQMCEWYPEIPASDPACVKPCKGKKCN